MIKASRFLPGFVAAIYVLAVTIGAFTGGMWASLGLGMAVVLAAALSLQDKRFPAMPVPFAFFALAVLLVLAAEIPFSSHTGVSFKYWVRLATIFIPLLVLLSPRVQQASFSPRLIRVTGVALALGMGALGGELLSGGYLLHHLKKADAALTQYNRGMAHTVILTFPLCGGLWSLGRRKEALVLAALLLFPASLTESRTAKLALIMGAAVAAFSFFLPRVARWGLGLGTVVLAGWPFYIQHFFLSAESVVAKLQPSWRHRVEIWDYLSYRIAERPVLGWGLGTTNTLDFTQPHGQMYLFAVDHAPHAHNLFVQIWVETGLPGLACGLAFLIWTVRAAARLPQTLRPFALGGYAAALIVAMFGFDFWTDALWACFALSAGLFGMLRQNIESVQNGPDVQLGQSRAL